jgi:predicted metal-dependent phosphoesterase TrpH
VAELLDWVQEATDLDVIAITDHERIDAAVAARAMAVDGGQAFEVIVGEEVTTLGGHLLALWIERPVKPFRTMRTTIAEVHDHGGIAIPAHPLVPYPLCAQGFALRRLAAGKEHFRPDGLEAFNPTTLGRPWHGRVVRFADELGFAKIGNSDAHALDAIGSGYTTFAGHDAEHLRAAILAGTTHHHGTFHPTGAQLGTFGQQLRKYGRDARANLGGRIRRDGTRRDLGYPRDYAASARDEP